MADVPEESDDLVTWNEHLYFTLQDLVSALHLLISSDPTSRRRDDGNY